MESYFLKIDYFLDNEGRPQWQIMDGRRDVTRDAGYEPMWVISDGRHFFVHFDRTQWTAVRELVDSVYRP